MKFDFCADEYDCYLETHIIIFNEFSQACVKYSGKQV